MSEIINLRQHRKTKTRDKKEEKAAANRAAFGQTKAAKELSKKQSDRAKKLLDGHRLDEDDPQ